MQTQKLLVNYWQRLLPVIFTTLNFGNAIFAREITQQKVSNQSKHSWSTVSSQSNHTHLTMLQWYNMHKQNNIDVLYILCEYNDLKSRFMTEVLSARNWKTYCMLSESTLWVKKNWATFLRPITLEILNRSLANLAQIKFSSLWTSCQSLFKSTLENSGAI